MMYNSFRFLWMFTLSRMSLAQFGGFGVGSNCYTNLNCGGNSICQSQRCACPSTYLQYGLNCYGGGYGGYGGYGGGGQVALVIQPGGSCGGGGGYCGGGSSCGSGYCNCPQNTIISGTYCQPINIVYPGSACNTYNQCGGGSFCINSVCNCPSGFMGASTGCMGGNFGGNFYGGYQTGGYGGFGGNGGVQITIYPGQACGANFGSTCGGGSFCSQGFCSCPSNYIVQNNICTQYGGGSFSNFGGIGGINSYQFGGLGGLGTTGFCNQQSPCGYNAQCINSQCQCSAGYYMQNGGCYRKKFYRSEFKKDFAAKEKES